MNEQLQQALAALLNKTVQGIDSGAAFLSAEVPDVIQQLLMYKLIESALWFSVGITLMISVFFVRRACVLSKNKAIKAYDDGERWTRYETCTDTTSHSYDWVTGPATFFVPGLIAFIGIVMTTANLDWVKIWIAPKIYLIEYAASLAK